MKLKVALIGKTIGLKGGLKLHDFSDFPEQFKKGAKFIVNDREICIKSFDKNRQVVVFEDFEDINLASNLANCELFRSVEDTKKFCKLKKDEFFYFDIIGSKIIENGEILGVINDIEKIGNSYMFLINTDLNLIEHGFAKIFFIPYLDNFIIKVDINSKEIFTKNAKSILENS